MGYKASYKELSEIARGDVRSIRRGNLTSAVRAEKRAGRIWVTERRVGIRRLTDEEIAGYVGIGIQRTHRKIHRVEVISDVVDYDHLTEQTKRRLDVDRIRLSAGKRVFSKNAQDALLNEFASKPELPDAKTLLGLLARKK